MYIIQYNRHTLVLCYSWNYRRILRNMPLNNQNSKSTNFKKTLANFHHLFAGLLTRKSACIRRVMRWPSRHRFLGFSLSSSQCHDGFRDSKLYCSPPNLYSSKLTTTALKWATSLFQIMCYSTTQNQNSAALVSSHNFKNSNAVFPKIFARGPHWVPKNNHGSSYTFSRKQCVQTIVIQINNLCLRPEFSYKYIRVTYVKMHCFIWLECRLLRG
jgi:hypothetical protein